MKRRTTKILDMLTANHRIKVSLLSEMLGVSQVTIRKDLDILEKQGFIRRVHGYATLEGADEIGRRMAFSYSAKRQIARKAASLVEDGETIMLESGSCCAFLAEELAMSGKNITIITNSIFIANYLRKTPNIKVIILGGCYQPESQVLVGPITVKSGKIFYTNKFFIGTDGFMPKYGFTGKAHMRVQTAKELFDQTKEIYVLTEAAKFDAQGVHGLIQFDKVTGVITDECIPKEAESVLTENNVTVYKVSESKSA